MGGVPGQDRASVWQRFPKDREIAFIVLIGFAISPTKAEKGKFEIGQAADHTAPRMCAAQMVLNVIRKVDTRSGTAGCVF